ncbi:hypothetical protein ABVT39_014102 [Epinephelus coioides]
MIRIGKKTPKATSGYERTLRCWYKEQKTVVEEMQEREHRWVEQQQECREQRDQQEENLVTRIIEQNTRSTERLIGMIMLKHIRDCTVAEAHLHHGDNSWDLTVAELKAFIAKSACHSPLKGERSVRNSDHYDHEASSEKLLNRIISH